MRIKILFKLFFIIVSVIRLLTFQSWAESDPFDKTKRNFSQNTDMLVEKTNQCHQSVAVWAENTEFKQLKIVGVLQYEQERKVFLMDAERHIFTAGQGDFLAKERIQLQAINTREVDFMVWNNPQDCGQGELMKIKF